MLPELYKTTSQDVFRYCMYHLHSKEKAEDATSETFMRFIQNPKSAEVSSDGLKPWLISIARNVIREQMSKKQVINNEELISSVSSGDEQDGLNSELMELVKEYLPKLDEFTQEVIILKTWEDMTFKEIAQVTESTESNCKISYYRGIEELKVMLGERKKSKKLYAAGGPLVLPLLSQAADAGYFKYNTHLQSQLWEAHPEMQELFLHIKSSRMSNFMTWAKANKWPLLIGSVILLAILVVGAVAILSNNQDRGTTTQSTSSSQSSSTVSSVSTTTPEPETTKFNGEFITADLPTGWTIKEYKDMNGDLSMATQIPGQLYKGLTTLEIINDQGQELFKAKVVNGIGSTQECAVFGKFSDTPQSYINSIDSITSAQFEIVTIADNEYTEFSLAGMDYRRVGSEIYRDTDSSAAGFQTACGVSEVLYVLNAPITYEYSFNGVVDDNVRDYQVLFSLNGQTEANLLKLDAILDSIAAK